MFLKNPWESWFWINTRSLDCPTTTFCFFKRDITFPAEYFLGFIYRLGRRVNSIFQTCSQTPIFNSVKHLQQSFFSKIVNSVKPLSVFAKKANFKMFDQVLKTSLEAATKRCIKVKHQNHRVMPKIKKLLSRLQIFYTAYKFLRSVTYANNLT